MLFFALGMIIGFIIGIILVLQRASSCCSGVHLEIARLENCFGWKVFSTMRFENSSVLNRLLPNGDCFEKQRKLFTCLLKLRDGIKQAELKSNQKLFEQIGFWAQNLKSEKTFRKETKTIRSQYF